MASTAFIFPGQGSQWAGMGAELCRKSPVARKLFDEANETLGFDLAKLCFEGPESELKRTANCQPALLATSLAFFKSHVAENGAVEAEFTAGHSLGEYTALAAAGSVDFRDALRLVRQRGQLMEKAGGRTPGAMVAVMGLEEDRLRAVCEQAGVEMANINSPGQIIISGAADKMPEAVRLATAAGARRTIPLEVSGAFHSALMRPAAEELADAVNATAFRETKTALVANVTGKPARKEAEIRQELVSQLCSPVQWQRSVQFMIDAGVTRFIEFGPGQVLTGLVKRTNGQVETLNVGDRAAK